VATLFGVGAAFWSARAVTMHWFTPARVKPDASQSHAGNVSPPILRTGVTIPRWVVHSREGSTLGQWLVARRGPTVVAIMAAGCLSCVTVLPELDLLAGDFARNAKFVIVVCGRDLADVDPFITLAKHIKTIKFCDGAMRASWDVRVLPTVVVLDPNQEIQWVSAGEAAIAGLRRRLSTTLPTAVR
jgi:hypothetical protein